jgi:hypothetical protein
VKLKIRIVRKRIAVMARESLTQMGRRILPNLFRRSAESLEASGGKGAVSPGSTGRQVS